MDAHGRRTFNHSRISESHARAVHRWRHGEEAPSLWTADAFLVAVGLHLDEFFEFCAAHGLAAWASGKAPPWHDEELGEPAA